MYVYLYVLVITMALGVPIVFCLAFAPLVQFTLMENPALYKMIVQRMLTGINQFPLMAIPFFILAGEVMNQTGITLSLIRLSNSLVGHLRGGLAQVNIVVSILFAGLSGSAVADTSAIGSILIPAMEKEGYSRQFSTAVTAASSVIGPIIPPSIMMVLYAFVMNVSVAGLFAAGIIPGLIVGLSLMAVTYLISVKRKYPKNEKRASFKEMAIALKGAFFPLLTPVIIMGGIIGGLFTPTEAAAVASAYAILVSILVLRTLTFRTLIRILTSTAILSSVILFIVATAYICSWLITTSDLSSLLTEFLFSLTTNVYLLLFLVNILLLITGMFMDASPAILILGPLIAPTMVEMGLHPIHFAIIMCVNLTVGLVTPPVGMVLFVAAGLTKLSVEAIARAMLPYLLIELSIIFLITYVPALSLTLPKLLGFY